jgi:2-polyprenyl-3-methyl-5-hydroxy-6-metoxy-1,4-benzoquinol methylase
MDLQELQRQLGFGGDARAVAHYQVRYLEVFPPGARVLDLGCGEGVFLQLLRVAGRSGVGVDRHPGDVARARAQGLEVIEQDALSYLAGQHEAFDGVFCAHLIEHLAPEDAVRLVEGAWSALRPGGRLVIITPDPRDLEVLADRFWLDLTHVRPYPLSLLVALLRTLGFEVLDHGDDPRSARGRTLRNLPRRALRWLRLGEHAYRGDAFVIAARPR